MLSWRLAPGACRVVCHSHVTQRCVFFCGGPESQTDPGSVAALKNTVYIRRVLGPRGNRTCLWHRQSSEVDSAIAYSMSSRFEHILRKLMEKYYVPDADRSNTAMHLIVPSCQPNDPFMTRSRDRRMFGRSSTFRTEHQRYRMHMALMWRGDGALVRAGFGPKHFKFQSVSFFGFRAWSG